ncbi:MAG: hypothetical protein PHQ04_01290 [Opitutaceae bacterium]|nr:hypothetical protein [Opitutaceae bacterium]
MSWRALTLHQMGFASLQFLLPPQRRVVLLDCEAFADQVFALRFQDGRRPLHPVTAGAQPRGRAVFLALAFVLPLCLHFVGVVLAFRAVAILVPGVTLSVVFQLAHCVEEADFPFSRLFEQACREYGVKHLEHESIRSGLASHHRWRRRMGLPDAAA